MPDRPEVPDWVRDAVDSAVVDRAVPHYTNALPRPTLPYHDWTHVVDALDAAGTLLDRCVAHGVSVDRAVAATALLFHDADYHLPLRHADRETRSAAVAGHELDLLGYGEPVRRRVADAVLATRPAADTDGLTDTELLVRAADLRGLGADYETFERNTEALRREHGLLGSETPARDEWAVRTVRTIAGTYLADDIRLTPEHDADDFHATVGANLGRLLHEYCDADRLEL